MCTKSLQGIDRKLVNQTIFVYFLIDQTEKNGGKCFDNEGTAKFSCTCTQQFVGERCDDDPCKLYPCLNNGVCLVNLIDGEKIPACECPENTDGPNCNLLFCGFERVPCYNRGTCTNSTFELDSTFEPNSTFYELEYYDLVESEGCQCSQENEIAKYHGESCEMPGRDACAGSPCQNGGSCTTIIQGEIQACFIINES